MLCTLPAHALPAAAGGAASFRCAVTPSSSVMSLRSLMALGTGGAVPCSMVLLPVVDTEVDVQEVCVQVPARGSWVAGAGC